MPKLRGQGFHEYVSPSGVDWSERCTTCYGAKEVETCGGCGKVPDVVSDDCGCTYRTVAPRTCEICERTVSAADLDNANVCTRCRDEMAAKIRQEEDERQAWVAEQLDFGRSVGWIQ